MMNLARKRPYAVAEDNSAAMIDRQPLKRLRPSIDQTKLSPADREAFERVAAVLQKPLSELYEGNPQGASINARVDDTRTTVYSNSPSWSAQSTQCDTFEGRQLIGPAEIDDYPAQPWTSTLPSGVIFEEHTPLDLTVDHWTDKTGQALTTQLGNSDLEIYSCSSKPAAFRTSQNWSHVASADEPWVGVPTNFLTQTDLQDEMIDHPEFNTRSGNREGPLPASGASLPAQDYCLTMGVRGLGQLGDITEEILSYQPHYEYEDSSKSNEKELSLGQDWEEVDVPQVSGHGSQLIPSMMTTRPEWSLIETPKSQEIDERIPIDDNSASRSVKWMPGDSGREGLSPHKPQPQRRRPFQDQQLREETSSTRKLKACVRCRMQKIRCHLNPNNPAGICQTCQAVSRQKIHTLPCIRYKLTECIIYRTGKARGLEFTLRWPVMKLTDISEWSDVETRTIKVVSDVCSIPLELVVRKFVPIPEDRLYKSWMKGTVKKFKETTPFAIVNMSATVKAMQDYINKHIFACMEHWLIGRDAWIQETYKFARLYMLVAPAEEAALLGDTFRLWFAIRRTATTEFIVGDETLDMAPETTDRSYPLFGKVPLPPVMIQQLDMILTLGFLQPLRKKFLKDFQRIIMANKPKSWMTIYLITFISLTSCAAVTAEHYENARKHGLKRRYAMPNFISERHHSANVYLAHYHYCTEACNPFTIDWRKRQTTPFAEMKPGEIHFLLKTSEMVKERKDKIRRINEIDLCEDDLYFVAQMFEENWMPREIILDYSDETISGASLKSPAKENSQV